MSVGFLGVRNKTFGKKASLIHIWMSVLGAVGCAPARGIRPGHRSRSNGLSSSWRVSRHVFSGYSSRC